MKERLDIRIQHGKLDIDETRVPMGLSWTHVIQTDAQKPARIHVVYAYKCTLPNYMGGVVHRNVYDTGTKSVAVFTHEKRIVYFIIFYDALGNSANALSFRNEAQKAIRSIKKLYREEHNIGPHNYHTFNRLS